MGLSPFRAVRNLPRNLDTLGSLLGLANLPNLAAVFVYNQIHPSTPMNAHDIAPREYQICSKVYVYPSAVATYYAPSDLSGRSGMHREHIRSSRSWRSGPPRFDCVFVERDPQRPGFQGLLAARIRLLLAFEFRGKRYPCALVEWYTTHGDSPDDVTGLWVVTPDFNEDGTRACEVIHVDCIIRGAHLIGVYGTQYLPSGFHPSHALDAFSAFYINKYADHHSHEIAF